MTEVAEARAPRLTPRAQTLGTTLLIMVLGVVTGVVVARLVGVSGRGELALVILWPSVIAYLGDLGLPSAYPYFAARREHLPALRANAVLSSAVLVPVLFVVGAPLIALALQGRGSRLVTYAVVFLACYLPLNLVVRLYNALYQGEQRFGRYNAVRLAITGSYFAGVLVLAALGVRSVKALLVVTVLSNVAGLALLVPEIRATRLAHRDRGLLSESVRFGLKAHLGNLTPVDSMQVDLLLVGALLTTRDAGLYSVALAAALVVRLQGTAIGSVALPAVATARGDNARAREHVDDAVGAALYGSAAAAALIALTAGWVVPLVYGDAFRGAVPYVRALVVVTVVASVRQVLSDGLRGFGRPLAASAGEVAALVVGGVAMLLLVPSHGLAGAVAGMSLAYATALVVQVGAALRFGLVSVAALSPAAVAAVLRRRRARAAA